MFFETLQIPDLVLITPEKHSDTRGFFSETFRADQMAARGWHEFEFVQDNHVYSAERGVLRGLHFQLPPRTQGKLVRCVRGRIFDVAVDIRVGSPTFGRHIGVELSVANWKQLWIPPGFAHGYLTLEPDCEVIYKVTDYYAPECDRGIAWDDPDLGVNWQLPRNEINLSEKDQRQPRLRDLPSVFDYRKTGS